MDDKKKWWLWKNMTDNVTRIVIMNVCIFVLMNSSPTPPVRRRDVNEIKWNIFFECDFTYKDDVTKTDSIFLQKNK